MTLPELYIKIEALRNQLDALKPMKQEDEIRLWKKFRLEWNYNSNHIEGNTLTYGHTELLLLFDKITGEYTGREIEEMKAHDTAVKLIRELAEDKERDLSERFVRELNKIILVRPYWKDAITIDGGSTKKEIVPGDYKSTPNSVRQVNGEIFHYASPTDTPIKMAELMDFYKTHMVSTETNPLWLAAMFHYKFVLIHPFDDGNGRLARLLMNFVLLKKGFPPVIIKDSDKKNYLFSLNKADTGDLEAFVMYIGKELIWSLEKSILAGQGKSIEDEDDIDKGIALLKREGLSKKIIPVKKSKEVLQNYFTNILKEILTSVDNYLEKFDDLFISNSRLFYVEDAYETALLKSPGKTIQYVEDQFYFDPNNTKRYGVIPSIIYAGNMPTQPIPTKEIKVVRMIIIWEGYKLGETKVFNIHFNLLINLFDFKYQISIDNLQNRIIDKLYNQEITQFEISAICNACGKYVLDRITNSIDTSNNF